MTEATAAQLLTRPASRVRRTRAAVLIASIGATALSAIAVIAIAVSTTPDRSILIGDVTGFQLAYWFVLIGLLAVACLLFTLPARRWWFLLIVPLRIATIIAITLGVVIVGLTTTTVTPLVAHGCPTGYIVVEETSSHGAIGVREGLHLSVVIRTAGDDLSSPFAAGAYSASVHDGAIQVSYEGASALPAFHLPLLPEARC